MNLDAPLHAIAQRVHALLECTHVTLSLSSPFVWSHPLLRLLTIGQEQDVVTPLLTLSPVQVLVTNAIRERTIQCDNDCNLCCYNIPVKSIAVVPIERPAGLLGVIVCIDSSADGFLRGEYLLLKQALPTIAREIEMLLCDAALDCVEASSKLLSVRGSQRCGDIRPKESAVVGLVAQQSLVSLVGHDLRLPLSAIKGYTGLLQAYGTSSTSDSATQADIDPELQRHYLDGIMEQAQHMEVLVNDLLDVSRIQRGQVSLHCTYIDIVALCRRVVQNIQAGIEQRDSGRYHIRFCPDIQATWLWSDPDRMQQVLTNLIENAIKYSPDGGLIEVAVRSHERSSSITVRDWGMGIPLPQQSSLFRMFERGKQGIQRDVVGLGLGLYIARTLVEAMNGSITLSSTEGQGTSISFTLPRNPLIAATTAEYTPTAMLTTC